MAKTSKEDFMKDLTAFIGDNTSNEAIKLLEDANDSFEGSDVTPYETEIADLKAKNEELEKSWREKYIKRFTDSTPAIIPDKVEDSVIDTNETEDNDGSNMTDEEIADLFI